MASSAIAAGLLFITRRPAPRRRLFGCYHINRTKKYRQCILNATPHHRDKSGRRGCHISCATGGLDDMLGRGKKFKQTVGASGALSNIVHESTNHGADTTLYCIMYKALDEKELASFISCQSWLLSLSLVRRPQLLHELLSYQCVSNVAYTHPPEIYWI
jgi:hypothetical protein